jgi:hypothetical protein
MLTVLWIVLFLFGGVALGMGLILLLADAPFRPGACYCSRPIVVQSVTTARKKTLGMQGDIERRLANMAKARARLTSVN